MRASLALREREPQAGVRCQATTGQGIFMKSFEHRFVALYALTALTAGVAAWSAGCGSAGDNQEEPGLGTATEASTASGNLPGGTSIKVTIDNPTHNLTVPPTPLAVDGTAEIGLGVSVANTLLVYTLDVSGSTLADGGCGGPAPDGDALPSGGQGLVGMRERVRVYGGDLVAHPDPDGGFVVRARIPLRQDELQAA